MTEREINFKCSTNGTDGNNRLETISNLTNGTNGTNKINGDNKTYETNGNISNVINRTKKRNGAIGTNSTNQQNQEYIIFDTDSGTDDAWALVLLLRGQKVRNYKILAITCVKGNANVDDVTTNVFRILNAVGRTDIPVYKGANEALIPRKLTEDDLNKIAGTDGFADVFNDHHEIDKQQLKSMHAVNAMYEYVCKYPKQISFFLVGPCTNFALCLSMYGKDFIDKVKEIHIMGGNIRGVGNTTRCAEFNFYNDPEAANIVLEKTTCPIIIVPIETGRPDNLEISAKWRLDTLVNTTRPEIQILNKAEEKMWRDQPLWKPYDAISVAVYLFENDIIEKKSTWHATVELNGKLTRGQMVLDHRRKYKDNVTIIERVNQNRFTNIVEWLADLKELSF